MGSIDPPELSLDFRRTAPVTEVGGEKERTWVPRTISDFIGEVSGPGAGGVREKLSKVEDYVGRLDEEMRKIDAFKRELPLCMLLLNDAIRTLKDESMRYKNTVNAEPVLEEFIPIKKDDDGGEKEKLTVDVEINKDKMSWMSSVQLWSSENPSPKPDFQFKIGESSKSEFNRKRVVDEEVKDDVFKSGKTQAQARAYVPFSGFELPGFPRLSLNPPVAKKPMADLDVCGNLDSKVGSGSIRGVSCSVPSVQTDIRALSQQQQQSNSRKQRRCWSPELHRRFVDALQRLGGCQVATPKQIRELMQVDGLTNDEVKSHLQKYRLHMRKLPSPTRNAANNQSLMVLGGLWMSQEHHGESSKQSNSQSGSPQCPLQLGGGASMGTSMTGGDSGGDSMEDNEVEKSESHSWKNHTILAS